MGQWLARLLDSPDSVLEGQVVSVEEVARAPNPVGPECRHRRVPAVSHCSMPDVRRVDADLMPPASHNPQRQQAGGVRPGGGLRQDPGERPRGPAPGAHAAGACPWAPPRPDARADGVPLRRQPAVAEDEVVTEQAPSTQLQAQVIVGRVGLCHQDEARPRHIQTVQQAIAVPRISHNRPYTRREHCLHAPGKLERSNAPPISVGSPAFGLAEHSPVRQVPYNPRAGDVRRARLAVLA
mmetsp:Transcript_42749/g.121905  ORF Transcript_42749/g.121905 Transcript_42749/m.121905 type:complete len:238 (-) Transcript_42749:1091-1804(-)